MASTRQSPIPEIYVLWHPACALGEKLAHKIYDWLRPGHGLGPQVFFRSMTAPDGPPGGLPIPLPGEIRAAVPSPQSTARPKVANEQIVLPLIDANMVADPAWRNWLSMLAAPKVPPHRVVIRPVALDATAYNVPSPIRDKNFLRPAGLAALAQAVDAKSQSDAFETVVRSLLKQLTETLCRYMLSERQAQSAESQESTDSLPKLKIFVSHAKADGTGPARRLRDYIYSQTQLSAFFDENDIAYGSAFANVLDTALEANETAALISVSTEQYSARPWCRREIALFRRPRQDRLPGLSARRWILHPTLVVDALESGRQTAGIAELGNSSLIRWDEMAADQPERVITTLLRDVMLGAFHAAIGATIPEKDHQIVINWLPDPTTLLLIGEVSSPDPLDVVHPGRGLTSVELQNLTDCFPRLTFHSFEKMLVLS
jgi:hypothetical protein